MTDSEGGIRPQRVEVLRETTAGTIESDPAWEYYSDNMQGLSWSPTPGVEPRRGLGDADVSEVHRGPEGHEVTVSYDLQQALTSGADMAADGILRSSGDNSLPNTHQMVARETIDAIPAAETWNGATSYDTRLFLVMLGGRVGTVKLSGDPGNDQPVIPELTYTAEKVREYQVDQPASATLLTVESSDASDSTQTVTIQGLDDASSAAEEDVSLSGTSAVSTSGQFTTIDAVVLDGDCVGDVTVSINDGDTTTPSAGDALTKIRGSDFYGVGEGDRGIPALGSGSHASTIGSAYETILDDTIERPSGTDLAYEINSVELTVENNLDTRTKIGTPRMAISAGPRDVTLASTIVGPTESMQSAEDALGAVESNLIWTLSSSTLTLSSAFLSDFGGVSKEVGQAAMSLDNTFTGQGITVA